MTRPEPTKQTIREQVIDMIWEAKERRISASQAWLEIEKLITASGDKREREAYKRGYLDAGMKHVLTEEEARKAVEARLKGEDEDR